MDPWGDDITNCPRCGAKFPSRYVRGCIRCGWSKPVQPPRIELERADPAAQERSKETAVLRATRPSFVDSHKKLVTAVAGLLLLAIVGGVVFYVRTYVPKFREEAALQSTRESYGRLLAEAESLISSGRTLAAQDALSRALDLPGTFDKTQARILLREIKLVENPPDALAETFSDTELLAICRTGALPPAYRLTYPPLDEQYRNKVLLSCYKERERRQNIAEADKKASAGTAQASAKEQEEAKHAAEEKDAQKSQKPSAPTVKLVSAPAKIRLTNGNSFSGVIAACQGCVIRMILTPIADDPSVTIQREYPCADIASIDFDTPDAALQKRIVKASLLVGNGALACAIAAAMNDDPTMKALSENQQIAKAVADLKLAQAALKLPESKVMECEAHLADIDKQPLSSAGNARSRTTTVQQSPYSRERDTLQAQLPHLKAQRDAARADCEKAQKALATLCQDVLQKLFPD